MKYIMNINICPDTQSIAVEGVAKDVNSEYLEQIYMNEAFHIKYIKSEKGALNFYFNKTGDRPPFDSVSRPIEIYTPVKDLFFSYTGVIDSIISNVNQINPDLIELACYAGWYPKIFDLQSEFEFDIMIEIPTGYYFTSNGKTTLLENTNSGKYRIQSLPKTRDIFIFASKKLDHLNFHNDILDINAYQFTTFKKSKKIQTTPKT